MRAHAIHQQRRPGRVVIAGNFDAFQDHQRCQRVERGEGHNDRQVRPIVSLLEEGKYIHRMGQIEFHRRHCRHGNGVDMQPAQHRHQHRADADGQQSRRQTIGKFEMRAIKGKQDEHGQQRNGRLLKDAEDKTQAKIGQAESRQGGEQCGARRVAAQPIRTEGSRGLHDAAKQAGENAGVPGQVCIVRPDINRTHDEEDIGEDGGRIDAEGDGGDIAAAFPLRQPPCLPCVEEISRQNGNRRAGKDAAGDKAQEESRTPAPGPRSAEDQESR